MLLVALAGGAVQITARVIQLPAGAIKIPTPAVQVRTNAARLFTAATQVNIHSIQMESSAKKNWQPEEFHWVATMHEHQTVEVHLGRGSIQVLPSKDGTVRVQARTDDQGHSEIQAVSTPNGLKFCDIVTKARESRNYCEPGQNTNRIPEDQPATEFVIYVPAGLHFGGSTVLGNIMARDPSADSDLATIDGNITFELADGADFNGNVIEGAIDSDFPLTDNTPTLPIGKRPTMNAPRIVHAIVGAGGPHLTAMVVNGRIRLLRRSTE